MACMITMYCMLMANTLQKSKRFAKHLRGDSNLFSFKPWLKLFSHGFLNCLQRIQDFLAAVWCCLSSADCVSVYMKSQKCSDASFPCCKSLGSNTQMLSKLEHNKNVVWECCYYGSFCPRTWGSCFHSGSIFIPSAQYLTQSCCEELSGGFLRFQWVTRTLDTHWEKPKKHLVFVLVTFFTTVSHKCTSRDWYVLNCEYRADIFSTGLFCHQCWLVVRVEKYYQPIATLVLLGVSALECNVWIEGLEISSCWHCNSRPSASSTFIWTNTFGIKKACLQHLEFHKAN